MDPRNLSDRDCRIAKRQLAVGNQAAAGTPAARIATNLHIPLATVMADLEAMGIIPERPSGRRPAPCPSHNARKRHRAHGETCSVCWPCGTTRARIRHRERREMCEQCSTPKTKRQPKPCGTYAAYVRHRNHGEQPCEACVAAMREYSLRSYRRSMARAKESAGGEKGAA